MINDKGENGADDNDNDNACQRLLTQRRRMYAANATAWPRCYARVSRLRVTPLISSGDCRQTTTVDTTRC